MPGKPAFGERIGKAERELEALAMEHDRANTSWGNSPEQRLLARRWSAKLGYLTRLKKEQEE